METRRLLIFILLAVAILFAWDKYFADPHEKFDNKVEQKQTKSVDSIQVADTGRQITVTTDLFKVNLNTVGGELQNVYLLKQGSQLNQAQPYQLLMKSADRTFIAQTGLMAADKVPNHQDIFTLVAESSVYDNQNTNQVMEVKFKAKTDKLLVIKSYIFKPNSYVIGIKYDITNISKLSINDLSIYWRLLRDDFKHEHSMSFISTFTGGAYYNDKHNFNKVKFDEFKDAYDINTDNGWIGFIEHYFATAWLLNSTEYAAPCKSVNCRFSFNSAHDKLLSAGVLADLPQITPGATYSIIMPLFVGPEDYYALQNAPKLDLTKDYGWVYIFATPLFWLLIKLFALVKNWGIAIVLLTLVVKVVLYPLTRAGYISIAKMRALAPKIEAIKAMYPADSDRLKMQQAIMGLYKKEKVNPVGGCLPMLLQIPVFIGLYWALLCSVELRYASFLWIKDLSAPDPIFVLPMILAITMFMQTFLNPVPADPLQAKMMRIMPVAFSVMFFFFPAGLVLYWLVNNTLSMLQQWYINNHVTLKRIHRK